MTKKTIQTAIDGTFDFTFDFLEKCSTTTSRAGHTVKRVALLHKKGVDDEVIALQMTKNSGTGTTYTKHDILAMINLFQDCKSKAPITEAQTTVLINDQKQFGNKSLGDEGNLALA